GDLALSLQAKLLRALESGEVMRVGSLRPITIDVRFIAATSRDLAADVKTGRFRPDLYHRINTVTVTVPPLRRPAADIEPLARRFLDGACARFGVGHVALSTDAVAALEAHGWPGNVRELRNVVERAVLLASGPVLEPKDLGLPPADAAEAAAGAA